MTDIQKQRFREFSGFDYGDTPDIKIKDVIYNGFLTPYPYNSRDWKYSPWYFDYVIEDNGNLIIELSHRMTNNRMHGWDKDGKELDSSVTWKYFKPHL